VPSGEKERRDATLTGADADEPPAIAAGAGVKVMLGVLESGLLCCC
jgi:hypothetical protein